MGITIHYTLTLPPEDPAFPDSGALRARWAVEDAWRLAKNFKRRGLFDAVTRFTDEPRVLRRLAEAYIHYDHPRHGRQFCDVMPLRGWMFEADVGEDCEPLRIGLCEYPARIFHLDEDRASRLRGWRFKAFSKTQYASLHGWEHFRRCHVAVLDFLAALRSHGFIVKIHDEGHYWPRRSERNLREQVGMMNRVIAAAAGAMKDAFDDGSIEAPIFAHPQFERLEAEGADILAKRK